MREAFISILALLALTVPTKIKCSEIGKDGFNFYKDYLRGRSDDVGDEGPLEDRVIYFYRTPLPLYPSLIPAVLEQEYKKRTGNAFKNHMLSKEMLDIAPAKRSSKTALSFLMQGKHPYFAAEKPLEVVEETSI